MNQTTPLPPHVLIFPFPLQGHVNSMLKLAELLCLSGLQVTFLISPTAHTRLLRFANIQSRFSSYPRFNFQTLPHTLQELHPHSSDQLMELYDSLKTTSKPFLTELLTRSSVSCIIADGINGFAVDVAQEIGIPIIYFRTVSSCAFWSYFCIPNLIEARELPFSNGDDLDVRVMNVVGMEGFLRRRDLPSFCRAVDLSDRSFQMIWAETHQTTRVQGLILNTFEDLEGLVLSQVRTQIPKVYTLGPVHAHLKTRLASTMSSQSTSSNSLWEEDKSCVRWLDDQPLKSVIYVSFGSIAPLTKDELMELWHGLVNSEQRFLWVRRPDWDDVEDEIPADIADGTKARGYMVEWAPQEKVLAHPAVGGFLTHSGWNSTLESIVEGVPMICWPFFADQQVNSRFVGEVWKIGLDMKDTCDRMIVEKMIKDLMVARRDEFVTAADQMAKLARKSLSQGGSSYSNLDRLIEDIRFLGVPSQQC